MILLILIFSMKGTFYKAGNLGNEWSKGYEAEITEIEFAE